MTMNNDLTRATDEWLIDYYARIGGCTRSNTGDSVRAEILRRMKGQPLPQSDKPIPGQITFSDLKQYKTNIKDLKETTNGTNY